MRNTIPLLVMSLVALGSLAARADDPPRRPSKEEIARNKAVRLIDRALRAAKPQSGARRSPDDFFIVGKVEVGLADRAAKVEFTVLEGQEKATEEIANFLLNAPRQTVRNWRIFLRVKDSPTADAGVREVRRQYDELQAYRERLMRAYKAATMCRT